MKKNCNLNYKFKHSSMTSKQLTTSHYDLHDSANPMTVMVLLMGEKGPFC